MRARGCVAPGAAWLLLLAAGRPCASSTQQTVCQRDPVACEPVILVPGLMSSRLYRVNASRNTDVLNGGTPPPVHERIWLPPFARLTWASAMFNTPEHKAWIGELMSFEGQGVRVEPDRGGHGLKGVACVLKVEDKKCKMEAKVFWDLIRELERVGYLAGKNLFAVPYDWRRRPQQSTFCAELAQALERATDTRGGGGGGSSPRHGGAHIVAHSLGALQTLHCLNVAFGLAELSRVASFTAIAAPLAGSPKSLKTLVSGAEVLSRYILTDRETRDLAREMDSAYLLLPHPRVWSQHPILLTPAQESGPASGAGAASDGAKRGGGVHQGDPSHADAPLAAGGGGPQGAGGRDDAVAGAVLAARAANASAATGAGRPGGSEGGSGAGAPREWASLVPPAFASTAATAHASALRVFGVAAAGATASGVAAGEQGACAADAQLGSSGRGGGGAGPDGQMPAQQLSQPGALPEPATMPQVGAPADPPQRPPPPTPPPVRSSFGRQGTAWAAAQRALHPSPAATTAAADASRPAPPSATAASEAAARERARQAAQMVAFQPNASSYRALFEQVERGAMRWGGRAESLLQLYESATESFDAWRAPPVPVVCVVGTGEPTASQYSYARPWPFSMDEDAATTAFVDGDSTVPRISMEAVCLAWRAQRACHMPLSTARTHKLLPAAIGSSPPPAAAGGMDGAGSAGAECVAIVELNCRQPDMQSADQPRGAEHCVDYHQRILGKRPLIDLVVTNVVNAERLSATHDRAAAALQRAAELGVWFQGHVRRLHAGWDEALASHVLSAEGSAVLMAQAAACSAEAAGTAESARAGAAARFSAPELADAWAALHDEKRHARTTASLHVLWIWVSSAMSAARGANAGIDARGAAQTLREDLVAYRAAARAVDVQLRALQAVCVAWRELDAQRILARRGAEGGASGRFAPGGSAERDGNVGASSRRSAGACAEAEVAQSGCAPASAAALYEMQALFAHGGRGEPSPSGPLLGRTERRQLERACAASPLGPANYRAAAKNDGGGESAGDGGESAGDGGNGGSRGAQQLLALHGSLLRYGSALDVAHDELQRR